MQNFFSRNFCIISQIKVIFKPFLLINVKIKGFQNGNSKLMLMVLQRFFSII